MELGNREGFQNILEARDIVLDVSDVMHSIVCVCACVHACRVCVCVHACVLCVCVCVCVSCTLYTLMVGS